MQKIIRIRPDEDLHKLYKYVVENSDAEISYDTFNKCRNFIWILTNEYDYVLAIIAISRIKYDELGFHDDPRKHPIWLYKIELLESFVDKWSNNKYFNSNEGEYSIYYSILDYAIKYLSDLCIEYECPTEKCIMDKFNALKNNKFKIIRIDDEIAVFMRR